MSAHICLISAWIGTVGVDASVGDDGDRPLTGVLSSLRDYITRLGVLLEILGVLIEILGVLIEILGVLLEILGILLEILGVRLEIFSS